MVAERKSLTVQNALPGEISLNGQVFVLTLMRIESRDEHNRPEEAMVIPPDRMVEVSPVSQFMPTYVLKSLMEKH